jgi:hypothetical protein
MACSGTVAKNEGGMCEGLVLQNYSPKRSSKPSAHTALNYADLELLKMRAPHLSP